MIIIKIFAFIFRDFIDSKDSNITDCNSDKDFIFAKRKKIYYENMDSCDRYNIKNFSNNNRYNLMSQCMTPINNWIPHTFPVQNCYNFTKFPCQPQFFPKQHRELKFEQKNKANITEILYLLSRTIKKKQADWINIMTNIVKNFENNIKSEFLNLNRDMTNEISTLNNNLSIEVVSLSNQTRSLIEQPLMSIIDRNNNIFLSDINDFVSFTNFSFKTTISSLATQASNVIVLSVQNLTAPTGLLQQLLTFLASLSTDIETSYSELNSKETAEINEIYNNMLLLSPQINDLVSQTTLEISRIITVTKEKQVALLTHSFLRLVNVIQQNISLFFNEYKNMAKNILVSEL